MGCPLMLGELSPVCLEVRKRLNACRKEQRKSRKVIYKSLEIGIATNFLVDELLEHRLGENVLALLTAVIPVLSENCYTGTLSMMCSTSTINEDSKRGTGQLQRVRGALLPFTNAMDIKNKILQYHINFCQYAFKSYEPHHGIPDAKTMSKLIHIFTKSKPRAIITAWSIVVLSAPDEPGGQTCVPISSGYQDARVVFCPDLETEELELRGAERMEELILTCSVARTDIEWTIDCDAISYFATHHPHLSNCTLHAKISEFVAAKTLDCVAEMSPGLPYPVNSSQPRLPLTPRLLPYQRYMLPSVQKRCLLILEALGFSPPSWETFEYDDLSYTKGFKASRDQEGFHDFTKPRASSEESEDYESFWSIQQDDSETWWPQELEQRFEGFLEYWSIATPSQDRSEHTSPEGST